MASSFHFDFSKWEPLDFDLVDDPEYDRYRAAYEELMWLVPAAVLKEWRHDFKVEMMWRSSYYERRCMEHWEV